MEFANKEYLFLLLLLIPYILWYLMYRKDGTDDAHERYESLSLCSA